MNNLNLSIPITIEPTAMIDIHENGISRQVQDMYGYMTAITEIAENISLNTLQSGILQSGIDITSYTISLNANTVKIGNSTLFENGKIKTNYIDANTIDTTSLYASKLNSITPSSSEYDTGSCIHIEDGNMEFYNSNNVPTIIIGVNSEGMAAINFYRNGTLEYTIDQHLADNL